MTGRVPSASFHLRSTREVLHMAAPGATLEQLRRVFYFADLDDVFKEFAALIAFEIRLDIRPRLCQDQQT